MHVMSKYLVTTKDTKSTKFGFICRSVCARCDGKSFTFVFVKALSLIVFTALWLPSPSDAAVSRKSTSGEAA